MFDPWVGFVKYWVLGSGQRIGPISLELGGLGLCLVIGRVD